MVIRKTFLHIAALAAFSTLLGRSASAVQTVNFPDVMTTNLVYSSIEESNNSIISGQTLFGGISSMGDGLVLQSTAFSLSSVGGADFLSADFDTTITANPGHVITSITVEENGLATTFGVGSTSHAYFDVTVIPANSGNQQKDASYTKVGTALPDSAMWDLGLTFNFAATNQVLLTIRNELSVDGTPGVASIGKDKVEIFVTTAAIPEPTSALAIMVFGLAGTAIRRRRRV